MLVPIVSAIRFTVPVFDDYNFGIISHQEYLAHNGLFYGALKACAQKFMNWQGFYTANFVAAIQPFNINVHLYWISNIIAILMLGTSFAYLIFSLLSLFEKIDFWSFAIITFPISFVLYQFLPSLAEGFYWMDGSLGLIFNGFAAIQYALLARYCVVNSKKKKIIEVVLITLALFFSGGGIECYITRLLISIIILLFCRKNDKRFTLLIMALLIIYTIGFLISILAPGNRVRVTSVEDARIYSIFESILFALYYGIVKFGDWASLCLLVVEFVAASVFYHQAKKLDFEFKYPVVVWILCFILYAAPMSIPLYAYGSLGSPRQYNCYYFWFIIYFTISALYFAGWLSKRTDLNYIFDNNNAYVVPAAVLTLLFVAGGFKIGYHNFASIQTGVSLLNNEPQTYYQEMMDRIEQYENEDIQDVSVSQLSVYPSIFMEESLEEDADYWTNNSVASYYGKNSVVLIDDNEY